MCHGVVKVNGLASEVSNLLDYNRLSLKVFHMFVKGIIV